MAAPANATFCAASAVLLLGGAANVALADNPCPSAAGPVALSNAQWNGWGRGLENTRYQPQPALRACDVRKLSVKWAFGYQNGTEIGPPPGARGKLLPPGSNGPIFCIS